MLAAPGTTRIATTVAVVPSARTTSSPRVRKLSGPAVVGGQPRVGDCGVDDFRTTARGSLCDFDQPQPDCRRGSFAVQLLYCYDSSGVEELLVNHSCSELASHLRLSSS